LIAPKAVQQFAGFVAFVPRLEPQLGLSPAQAGRKIYKRNQDCEIKICSDANQKNKPHDNR
jgi:hypothetical protein